MPRKYHVDDGEGVSRHICSGELGYRILRALSARSGPLATPRGRHQGLGKTEDAADRKSHRSREAKGINQAVKAKRQSVNEPVACVDLHEMVERARRKNSKFRNGVTE